PHFVRPSVKDAPLLLCQICRRWRAIALTTPQLWVSLNTDQVHHPGLVELW
ncbi:hypothetical protein DFH07DRAFT_683770, partial [Mycena maculata]